MDNVHFRNFWAEENSTKSLLRDIFRPFARNGKRVTVTSTYPKMTLATGLTSRFIHKFSDLDARNERRLLTSYQLVPPDEKADINIWYSAENVRCPIEGYDLSISCDQTDELLKNIYLPYWATQGGKSVEEVMQFQRVLLNPRESETKRENSICALVGNPHPTRLHILKILESKYQVDCFGSVFGKSIKDKENLLKRYRFNLCFENDLYPGYVSEKPIESWLGGCIPIWWGLDRGDFLNPNAIVNFTTMTVLDLINRIDELENHPQKVIEMVRTPILQKPYNLRLLQEQISDTLGSAH